MFTWIEEKNHINKKKHGFYLSVILYVVTVDKIDGNIQIITAREATKIEQEAYYEHYQKSTNSG